jgi:lysosomal acid lipase/cholesteryl ester hydrolase
MKFLILLLLIIVSLFNSIQSNDSDEYLNTIELIASKGYLPQSHNVLTKDGYILEIHRVNTNNNNNNNNNKFISYEDQNKPVVFLMHGLLDSSSTFVLNMPNQSLAFILADSGFDVWLGNTRGNVYGRKHIKYNINDIEFWNWSWDEIASNDLPAMINFILNYTNQEQLFYIGHSQGSLTAFAQLNNDLDLASKIRLFIGLGEYILFIIFISI